MVVEHKEQGQMRKLATFLLAACVLAGASSAVWAQSTMWFDIRDNTSANQNITTGTPAQPFGNGQGLTDTAFNAGGRGDGQVLRLNPVVSNNFHMRAAYPNFDGDGNLSTGNLWLYIDVAAQGAGATGDCISSIGVNFDLSPHVGTGTANQIASVAWTWDAGNWAGTNAGTAPGSMQAGSPPDWNGAKAVKVPVNSNAVYDTTGGLTPNAQPYRLGSLRVTAGNRVPGAASHTNNSTYKVLMSVNELLITRVFQTGGDATEMVAFGYNGASPDTPVSGSTQGATSTNPDAIIQVMMKGDRNGNGTVTGIDSPGFTDAARRGAGIKQVEAFLYNNNGGTGGAQTTITGIDSPSFTDAARAPGG
jgi:hypothetical protein